MYSHNPQHYRNIRHSRSGWLGLFGLALLLLLVGEVEQSSAQPPDYRDWYDSAAVDRVTITRKYPSDFPVGIFFYTYNQVAMNEVWDYMERINADYAIYSVEKGVGLFDYWGRYQTLINSAPAGKYVVPLPIYAGIDGVPSYINQSQEAREAVFYPFDTSEMRAIGALTNLLTVSRWYDNVFTQYNYDALGVNLSYPHDFYPEHNYREAIYVPAMAGDTVASGIAFRYQSGQSERWDSTFNGTSWVPTMNPINSSELFDGVDYAYPDPDRPGYHKGDYWNAFRLPHYLVVKGHLFEDGEGTHADTMLILNVYYEVGRGKTYRDSANVTGVPDTAATNMRFLYKSVAVTRGELFPVDLADPDWEEYRIVAKRINFQREGMGGPTDTGVTAKSIDLEVIYVGTEKMALHSVSIRDSITHMLWTDEAEGVSYRNAVRREIDTLAMKLPDSTLKSGFLNVYGSDEPPMLAYNGFRGLQENVVENNPLYAFGPGDTMTAEHGWALPYLQWNGNANRSVVGSYIGTGFWNFGDYFDIKANGVSISDIPSAAQHNGGRFDIPLLFDFDSMSVAGYYSLLKGRIDTMELIWQHGRLGAAIPGQDFPISHKTNLWRMKTMYETAHLGRVTGRRYTGYAGLQSNFKIFWDAGENRYDTIMDHRFVRAEVRAMLNSMVLGYGSYGLVFYKTNFSPWFQKDSSAESIAEVLNDTASNRDTNYLVSEGGFNENGFAGIYMRDSLYNVINMPMQNRKIAFLNAEGEFSRDTFAMFGELYFGFRDTYTELKSLLPWYKQLGPVMKRLRWRDAYSVHFQVDEPAAGYDGSGGVTHRTLPSDEIVTNVRSWHPVTGEIDSAWRTYVELGFYDTMIDTTGGVRNRLLDTNWISVTNRRAFSVENYDSADIGYSAATKAVLDTLTGTRVIELDLNLRNPDTSDQYSNFVRVQEVFPDTAHLPLIGKRARVDTVLDLSALGTGKFNVLLGPGRACLLMVTYAQPDESMIPGILTRNNQRKCLYLADDQRYMAVYHRFDSNANDWHVYLRRSLPMDSLGAVLWEPIEHWISTTTGPADPISTQNSHPSLTWRRINDSSVIASVVWTAHPWSSAHASAGEREVLLRELVFKDYFDSSAGLPVSDYELMPIKQTVGYHKGLDPEQWGTPVISSSSADSGIGEYIAWSDSTAGIIARGVLIDSTVGTTPGWTPYDTLSAYYNNDPGAFGKGQYPAMPPFTHRAMKQQSAPVVWQQSRYAYTGIVYGRLHYVPPPGGPKLFFQYPLNTIDPHFWISPPPTEGTMTHQHIHPTIDQSQDALGRLMEGVGWERHYYEPIYLNGEWAYDRYFTDIHFRSMFFDTASGEPYIIGDWISKPDWSNGYDPGYGFPVISSQNQVLELADSSTIPLFSIIYMRPNPLHEMYQIEAKWLMNTHPQWRYQNVKAFTYGGLTPNGSASEGRLLYRYAALYARPDDSTLRTTRQYYARSRPDGYEADGREISAKVNDSLGLAARLYDVWISDAEQSIDIDLVPSVRPDSLSDLLALLRTESFSTGDSVEIGGTMYVQMFAGDSSASVGRRVDCVLELVDSATDGVVEVLDSTALRVSDRSQYRITEKVFDVLSGTYYIRLRLSSSELVQNVVLDSTSIWSIGAVRSWVDELTAKRVRTLDGEAGTGLRVSAQPNPFTGETEIRFSISRKEHVTLGVYDALGRKVASLVEKELYEPGRYAVGFDGTGLKPGTYIVELQTLNGRVTEKVVVRR